MAVHAQDPIQQLRKFYTEAAVEQGAGGFAVVLDGRPAKTPAGSLLVTPTRALGALLASEWNAQAERIEMASMPATRLAFTAIDRAQIAHAELADEVARFAASDVLCYFAEAPTPLVEAEIAHWGPVIAWAQDALGVAFVRASGVTYTPQPPDTIARLRQMAAEMDGFVLTGLVFASALFGSAILAFALRTAMLSGDAAFDLSRLDEAYQEARWGVDTEAATRTAAMRRDALVVEQWFKALEAK